MTFKSQFSASREKAHNRIIATKIHEELSELRAGVDASPTIPKRWVWELIQNAKDVNIGGKVRVRIEADLDGSDAHVTFNHNGGAFSAENIRFLIEQVSSKSRTKDSTGRPTTTGKFGTGFLTTHLLVTIRARDWCREATGPLAEEVRTVSRPQRHRAGRHHRRRRSRENVDPRPG